MKNTTQLRQDVLSLLNKTETIMSDIRTIADDDIETLILFEEEAIETLEKLSEALLEATHGKLTKQQAVNYANYRRSEIPTLLSA